MPLNTPRVSQRFHLLLTRARAAKRARLVSRLGKRDDGSAVMRGDLKERQKGEKEMIVC